MSDFMRGALFVVLLQAAIRTLPYEPGYALGVALRQAIGLW
ncbi:hypothetical protein [Microvirga sp. VF16]|nr:hypothetical protein [Microvirga sp. VF16]